MITISAKLEHVVTYIIVNRFRRDVKLKIVTSFAAQTKMDAIADIFKISLPSYI